MGKRGIVAIRLGVLWGCWCCIAAMAWSLPPTVSPDPPPLDPQSSLARIHLRRGYALQLVAAEPLVADPVAIDWGPDGRLWVAEMADYPYGLDGRGQPGGRVRVLDDTNADGVYDRSVIFLEGISFPTAVMPWEDGALVTAAPELFFARDTDGDGRADERTVLYRGFMEGNQQLRVNGLQYGLDNWVYCAAGGHHAGFGAENSITQAATGQKIPLGSRDFRFDPRTQRLEPQSGPSQFGRVRDDWNHWFGVQNSYPLWHYVLDDADLRRNPRGRYPDVRQQLRLPANPAVFAAKPPDKRYHSFEQAGHYTSACGPGIYRDELLFSRDAIVHAFTCEPFHNVVQHHHLRDAGVTFAGERAATDESYDFFASSDYWTRPVMARTGPDGALWIVDMYRYMIEHPDWLPPEGRAELEPFYRSGEGLGRIYRVFPQQAPPPRVPNLASFSDDALVDQLASSNGPVRDLAQQLLLSRQATQVVPKLQQMAVKHPLALARLHAVYTLDGFDRLSDRPARESATDEPADSSGPVLTDTILMARLRDEHPELRRHALRLAAVRAATSPELATAICELADDGSAKVRLQLAITLGEWPGWQPAAALATLASRPDLDDFQVAAITSSTLPHLAELVTAVAAGRPVDRRLRRMLVREANSHPELLAMLLESLITRDVHASADQLEALADWLDSLRDQQIVPEELVRQVGPAAAGPWNRLPQVMAQARERAFSAEAAPRDRVVALGLLRHDAQRSSELAVDLRRLLNPQTPTEVQVAVIPLLRLATDPAAVSDLIERWPSLLPAVRLAGADQMTAEPTAARLLLEAVLHQRLAAQSLDTARRDRLLHHPDAQVAALAQTVFKTSFDPQRAAVIQRFQAAELAPTVAARGRLLFDKHCASCHVPVEQQPSIAPDLKSLSDRSNPVLLSAILDPSRAVEPKYLSYHLELKSGEVVYGLIVSESGLTLRIRQLDGTVRDLIRDEIETLTSSQRSFMPDGFEVELSPQDVADVIRYIQEMK